MKRPLEYMYKTEETLLDTDFDESKEDFLARIKNLIERIEDDPTIISVRGEPINHCGDDYSKISVYKWKSISDKLQYEDEMLKYNEWLKSDAAKEIEKLEKEQKKLSDASRELLMKIIKLKGE